MVFTVVNQAFDLPGMIPCIAGGARYACDTEFAASAFFIVIRAIDFTPGVGAADFH